MISALFTLHVALCNLKMKISYLGMFRYNDMQWNPVTCVFSIAQFRSRLLKANCVFIRQTLIDYLDPIMGDRPIL